MVGKGREVVDALHSCAPIYEVQVGAAQGVDVQPLGSLARQSQVVAGVFSRVVEVEPVYEEDSFDGRGHEETLEVMF